MKVTLFPFLSVLLCLMGAMIMLLVVVAKNVREQTDTPLKPQPQTQQATVEKLNEQLEEIKNKTEEALWYSEQYKQIKQQNEEKLAELQSQLALVEKETQKVIAEIQRLAQLAQQLENNKTPPQTNEQLKRQLDELKLRREQAELELAELQKNVAEQKKSYAIVPHKGMNGTFRRPIYIECRDNKIVIQPEGIELVPSDFVAADRTDNPFDAVLRTIRQYLMETNQTARGSEPYPLFIIKPSGVEMYAKARTATGNWVQDYGYELVNEDWHIEYQPPSEDLKQRAEKQLALSRSRLTGLMIAMRESGYNIDGRRNGHGSAGSLRGSEYREVPQYRTDEAGNVVPLQDHIASQSAKPATKYNAKQRDNRGTGEKFGESVLKEVAEDITDYHAQKEQEQNPNPELGSNNPHQDTQYQDIQPNSQQNHQQGDSKGAPKNAQQGAPKNAPSNPQSKDGNSVSSNEPIRRSVNSISRSVKIRCEADKFVLVRQAGLSFERSIPINDDVRRATEQLIKAVMDYQETWGSAGEGMSWNIVLRISADSGGERHSEELKNLLQRTPFEIQIK